MRQIVLLRGVNLGSRNRVAMPLLRDLLVAEGFEHVSTYVQSGNVVLSAEEPPDQLAQRCAALLAERLGLDVDVLVRTRDELAEVVRRNPLADVAVDPRRYQVSFLERELEPEAVAALERLALAAERVVAIGREVYGWHPDGIGRSRLWGRLASRDLEVKATARNWATVSALLALADA